MQPITFKPRPYQVKGIGDLRTELRKGKRSIVYVLPTGGGKCQKAGTPVVMHDGTVRPIESIRAGESVMGPDSKPRLVLSTCTGREMMYRVTPVKGDVYEVNESHILSLKITGMTGRVRAGDGRMYQAGDIVNINVLDYLASSPTFKHVAKGWRTGVDFPGGQELPVPAYILGIWLGDGTAAHGCEITNQDQEVLDAWYAWCEQHECSIRVSPQTHTACSTHCIVGHASRGRAGASNPCLNALRATGTYGRRSIPLAYRTASRADRLELLAGILDTDGCLGHCGYDLIAKDREFADDVAFLARSLGFACYITETRKRCTNTDTWGTYYRMSISGDVALIPCRVPRRKASARLQKKDVLVTGITVEAIGEGDYYGFELAGPDHLYLMGDFTVTHNTFIYSVIAQGAAARGNRVLILEHRKELLRQASMSVGQLGVVHQVVAPPEKVTDIRRRHLQKFGYPMVSSKAHVAVASVQTLGRRMDWLAEFDPKVIIIDEAHHAVAGTWERIIKACPNAILVGVTATPGRTDGRGLGVAVGGCFDTMVLGPSPKELIADGYLLAARVFSPPLKVDLDKLKRNGKGDYADGEIAAAMDKPSITGDAIKEYREHADGRLAIAFCSGIRHAHNVCAAFRKAGYRWEVVTGDDDDDDRDDKIMGLAEGRIHGLCTVDVVSEGTDIPVAEVAIMLRPTESESLFLQQAGRVLRPVYAEGFDMDTADGRLNAIRCSLKPFGIILDLAGNVGRMVDGKFVLKHGLPHADRQWTLEGRTRKERQQQEANEPDVVMLRCRGCYFTHDAGDGKAKARALGKDGSICCPACGLEHEAKAREYVAQAGTLAEVTETLAEEAKPRIPTGDARDMAALRARGVGYAQAAHILQARAEKETLQKSLRAEMEYWSRQAGITMREGWGVMLSDINDLKPKQLKTLSAQVTAVTDLIKDMDRRERLSLNMEWLRKQTPEDIRSLINDPREEMFVRLPASRGQMMMGV